MNKKNPKKSNKGVLKAPLFAASVAVTLGGWIVLAGGNAAEESQVSTPDWSEPLPLEGVAGTVELPAIPTVVPTADLFGEEPSQLRSSLGLPEIPKVSVPAKRRLPVRTRSSK